MKKLLSNSTLAVVSTALLVGCSNNTTMPEPSLNKTQESVKIASNSGLNDYIKGLAKIIFSQADNNKDGLLSLSDYLALDPLNSITENEKKLIFKKLDADSDGFISFEDTQKNIKLFMSPFKSYNKEQLRLFASNMFNTFDGNKNLEVSFKEFIEYTMKNMSYMFNGSIGLALSGYMFEASDKNKNNSLNFNEFEDFYYNFSKGMMRGFYEGSSTLSQPVPQPSPINIPDANTPGYSNPYPDYPSTPDTPNY